MHRIAISLAACLLAIAGTAAAQSTTSPQSPNDPLSRMLARVPRAPAAPAETGRAADEAAEDEKPPSLTRDGAIEVFDKAIGFAKSFRGAAKVQAVGGISPQTARDFERDLRADRVDAATADRPNEWTAALMQARARIATFVQATPTCPRPEPPAATPPRTRGRRGARQSPPAPAASVTPPGWTVPAESTAVEDWADELHTAYCELGRYLLPGPPPTATPEAEEEAASTFAASFLPFAALTAGNTAPQASAQLADLFFTNRWRLNMRSTYQPKKAETEKEAEEEDDDGPQPTAEELAKQIDDKVRNAMLDPFGGDLNLTFGHYSKVRTPFLEGNANDAEHGLFVDARAGMKLIELPEQSLTLNEGPSKITPFYTGSIGVRLRLPTYFDRLIQHRAGATELAIVYGLTGIVDRNASTLFSRTEGPAALPRQVKVLHISLVEHRPHEARVGRVERGVQEGRERRIAAGAAIAGAAPPCMMSSGAEIGRPGGPRHAAAGFAEQEHVRRVGVGQRGDDGPEVIRSARSAPPISSRPGAPSLPWYIGATTTWVSLSNS